MKFKPLETITTYHKIRHKVPGKYYEYRNGQPEHNQRDTHLYPVARHHRKLTPQMSALRRNRGNVFALRIWLKINNIFKFFKYRI